MQAKTITSLLILALCTLTLPSTAQKASIKAIISDTAAKQKLQYAVIALFNTKDSLLVTSTRSLQDGSFVIEDLKAGSYHLMVTYPKMADFILDLTLKDTGSTDIGKIIMTSREHLLQEVTVRTAVAAIRMKGDTLEYKADSFAVKPGANVEELLKRLPGIEVNRDGTIKAQGEKVTQVLVDGDEFFSDDPTLATKYLQASGVDKIQVFDKKSDQSAFTGVDDGKRAKTINIKLKENSKQGYFGKLSAGTDANKFYNNEAMFNRFRNKQKVSVFGLTSNTGVIGLSNQDKSKYASTDNERIEDESGSLLFERDDDYESGTYYGSGLPASVYTGAQFSDKWNDNKEKINGNYRYNRLLTDGWEKSNSTQIFPDSSLRKSTSSTINSSWQNEHKAAGSFDAAIDSFASVKIFLQGRKKETAEESMGYSETTNGINGNFLNTSMQLTKKNGGLQEFNGSALWRQKFRKVGRTLSLNLQHSNNNHDNSLQSEAVNLLYDSVSQIPVIESPNQLQKNKIITNAYAAKLAYTEPLSKKVNFELAYAIKITNMDKERMVYDKNTVGKYEKFIDTLSSVYLYKITSHMPSLLLHFNSKKYSFTAGGKLGFTSLQQQDATTNISNRNFINFFPQTNLRFNMNMFKSLSISYNGRTQQPALDQLQPLRDKSNSLSESIGNPDLKPSFTHDFSLQYFSFKMSTGDYMSGNFNFSFTQNDITSSEQYGQFNKSQFRSVNVDGNSFVFGYFNYEHNIKKLNLRMGGSINIRYSKNINVINGVNNSNQTNSIGISPDISYTKPDKFSISIRSSINYSASKSNTGNVAGRNMISHNHTFNASVFLPWKMELASEAQMDFQPFNPAFNSSRQVIKWNASLIKKLTKDDKLEAKLAVFDILNQNTGYSRYATGNNISETSSNYIPRYGMLSLVWNFTHTHK